jgi:hypothetical protein
MLFPEGSLDKGHIANDSFSGNFIYRQMLNRRPYFLQISPGPWKFSSANDSRKVLKNEAGLLLAVGRIVMTGMSRMMALRGSRWVLGYRSSSQWEGRRGSLAVTMFLTPGAVQNMQKK